MISKSESSGIKMNELSSSEKALFMLATYPCWVASRDRNAFATIEDENAPKDVEVLF